MKKNKTAKKIYTEKEYQDSNGMLTTIWGPGIWHFLHTISFNYPIHPTNEIKQQYIQFIEQLQYVLPCGKCRENLKKNLKHLPLTIEHMKNRHTFSLYIYKLHELVNKMLKKKSGLSYQDVRERYEHFRARCVQENEIMPSSNKLSGAENGCIHSLTGEKTKCVLHFVPQSKKIDTFLVDNRCLKKRITMKKKRGI